MSNHDNSNNKCGGYILKKTNLVIKKCHAKVKNGHIYCKRHKYFEEFEWNNINELDKCSRHVKFFPFGTKCEKCKTEKINKQQEKQQYDQQNKCEGYQKKAKLRCREYKIDGTNHCKKHSYMNNYTDFMKNNLKYCKGCKRWIYDKKYKTCDDCRGRGSKDRAIARSKKIICKSEKCTFKAKENGYCSKHKREYERVKLESKKEQKFCSNHVRGCTSKLDYNSKFSYCKSCRIKRNKSEKKSSICEKRAKKDDIPYLISEDMCNKMIVQHCFYCGGFPKEGLNGIDRIKSKYKDGTNYPYSDDNIVPCCQTCNYMKHIEEVDNFIKYCDNINNNFGCEEVAIEKRKHCRYSRLDERDKNRNIPINLSKKDYHNILKNKCYYCADTNNSGQIGVDRIDSDKGYFAENCVASCSICNYMKGQKNIKYFRAYISKICKHMRKKNIYVDKNFDFNIFNIYRVECINFVPKVCEGFDRNFENCTMYIHKKRVFCFTHEYMEHIDISNPEILKNCGKCYHFYDSYGDYCNDCYNKGTPLSTLLPTNTINNNKCRWILKSDNDETMQCRRNITDSDKIYCDTHNHAYDYTQDQLNEINFCNKCRKYCHCHGGQTCRNCKYNDKQEEGKDN